MSVVPATWEAKARGSLEPRKLRLQWAMIMPLHPSLSDSVRSCLKKKRVLIRREHKRTFYDKANVLPWFGWWFHSCWHLEKWMSLYTNHVRFSLCVFQLNVFYNLDVVVPEGSFTTREAEVGRLLEPKKQRLQWTEITPHQPCVRVKTLSLKKKPHTLSILYSNEASWQHETFWGCLKYRVISSQCFSLQSWSWLRHSEKSESLPSFHKWFPI